MTWSKIIDSRRALVVAAACCVALSGPLAARADTGSEGSAPSSPSRVPARVVAESPERMVFRVELHGWMVEPSQALEGTDRVTVPGFIRDGQPGEPSRPSRKYMVGLPSAGGWTLSWRVLESAPLGRLRLEPVPFQEASREGDLGVVPVERYEIDPAIYDSYRADAAVTADDAAWIRRQRVLPLWVNPLSYDPATGEATLVTSIEITVTFRGAREGDTTPERTRPSVESADWEETMSRLIVNPGQSRGWRVARRVRPAAATSSAPLLPQGPLVKFRVRETGVYKVTADALVAAGFPSGQPVDELQVFKAGYDEDALAGTVADIAYKVREHPSGTSGAFDGQDILVFYGERLREDPAHADPNELYSDHNVYWLGTAAGLEMVDRTLSSGYLSADTANAWFPVTRRFTDDKFFFEDVRAPFPDYYFFNNGAVTSVEFPFEVGAVRAGAAVSLTADLHGGVYNQIRSISTSLVSSQGTTVIEPTLFVSNKSRVTEQWDVPASSFDVGENTFRFVRADQPGQWVWVHLNWLDVSYEAAYRARGNSLTFNTATMIGDTSVTVTGLSDTDLWLLDVTDPSTPINCALDAGLFTDVGGSYALTFRDAIAARKQYVLLPESRMFELQDEDVILDDPSAIIGDQAESGVDVLVVSHGSFLADLGGPDMHDWVRYRRAQGYDVLMVDVEDVYDEFNGGVPGTLGIDRFVRHFYELGNAGYLVLVGDGSEDHKRVHPASFPDFVPSHCRSEYVASGFNEDEVVTLDKEFVKMPGPTGIVDAYPDLVVGRIPVGNTNELQIVIDKVFLYEKPLASDFWRRRMILIADDGWGEGVQQSCWRGETGFEISQERCAQTIESAYPGTFDVVRFFLSDYTDEFHPVPPFVGYCDPNLSMFQVRERVRRGATLALLSELRQGATLVTIQAHMNRSLVAHEWLFVTLKSTGGSGTSGKDHTRCNNQNKPFIIFGMGCHFSDYALVRERDQTLFNEPNGDSFAEQLLFQQREAAVSTYGSSGFEYLGQVNNFMERCTEIWFYEAPYDTMVAHSRGQWVFGPMMFLVEAEAIRRHGQRDPVDRYHILGDPLLRMDAGPPRMDVTVNGQPVQSGANISAASDTIAVVATVRDENVIEDFELWIDGADMSDSLTVSPLGDEGLDPARGYEVRFRHALMFKSYDIVLKALQAPDAENGGYHMQGEFVLHVPNDIDVTVNGRVIGDGDVVPTSGNYEVTLNLPIYTPSSEISIAIDDEDVPGLVFSHPSPEDTTTWVVGFSKTLSDGSHLMVVTAGTTQLPAFNLIVSSQAGLRSVLNYPNPFTDATQFVYSNDVEIDQGTIDVFTVSGKKIVRLEIPPDARTPGQNAVYWNGRDAAGDEIANGVYLYVIRVTQRGQDSMIRGKLARMK